MLAVLNGHVSVLDALVKKFNSICHVRGYNSRTQISESFKHRRICMRASHWIF